MLISTHLLKRRNSLRSFCLIFISIQTAFALFAQNPFPAYGPIYKDDVVSRVDIVIPPDSLAVILAPGNEESEYHFHATFMFDNGLIRDTFENIGFQLRGNTSRYAKKKSFQISLNTYVSGRLWHGVEKLNLNGQHNDPSVSRSKIAWDLIRDMGIPAPRSNHVDLYINGDYYGLYANIEHIDEEFVKTRFGNNDGNLYKCTYPADLVYRGSDPDVYKYLSDNERAYELKTNEEKDDYSDLAHLIDVLNNTPIDDLRCELEGVFNINSYLKSMAFDILSGNWDGPLYNKNNFFLYHNLSTGLFEYIPYDLDNTFGISWFNINWAQRDIYNWGHDDEPRPLYWRILEVPVYRDRLSYYMNQMITEVYTESVLFPRMDSLKELLAPSIVNDTYYSKDYGFHIGDFNKSFNETLSYPHTPVGIKPFIATRRSSSIEQLDINNIAPIISNHDSEHTSVDEPITIRVSVEDDQGVAYVDALIELNGSGQIEVVAMHDDGLNGDDKAGDGIYSFITPAFGECVELSYSIFAFDLNGNESRDPYCGTRQLVVCNSSLKLSVNEFMASNENSLTDDHGEYEDWVEIYNYGTETIDLDGLYMTDKEDNPTKWALPDTFLQAGEYLVIWADEDLDQGVLHADFKLSAGGEYIGIYDHDTTGNALIDGLEFGEQQTDKTFGRFPNGTGPFQILKSTPGRINELILSVSEDDISSRYQVYPNPARDVIYIKSMQEDDGQHQIVLLNIFGQMVMNQSFEKIVRLDISQLAGGIYLVGSEGEDGLRIISKVVKE